MGAALLWAGTSNRVVCGVIVNTSGGLPRNGWLCAPRSEREDAPPLPRSSGLSSRPTGRSSIRSATRRFSELSSPRSPSTAAAHAVRPLQVSRSGAKYRRASLLASGQLDHHGPLACDRFSKTSPGSIVPRSGGADRPGVRRTATLPRRLMLSTRRGDRDCAAPEASSNGATLGGSRGPIRARSVADAGERFRRPTAAEATSALAMPGQRDPRECFDTNTITQPGPALRSHSGAVA